jgi:DNA polymerase-3 subunit delta
MVNKVDLIDKIDTKKKLFVIFGDNNYLIDYYSHEIQKKFLDDNFKELNYTCFCDFFDINHVLNAALVSPFDNNYRIIFIKYSKIFLKNILTKELISEFIKKIIDIDTTLIFFFEHEVDKQNKFFQLICNVGSTFEVKNFNSKQIADLIRKICKQKKIIFSQENILFLIKFIPNDMNYVLHELDKLISYKVYDDNKKEITKDDIKNICTKQIEGKIFDLVAAIGNRNMIKSCQKYSDLIFSKEPPLLILNMIARQFFLIFQTQILFEIKKDQVEIAQILGVQRFVIKDIYIQSKNFSRCQLIKIIRDLDDLNYKIKLGVSDGIQSLENFIVNLCNQI